MENVFLHKNPLLKLWENIPGKEVESRLFLLFEKAGQISKFTMNT